MRGVSKWVWAWSLLVGLGFSPLLVAQEAPSPANSSPPNFVVILADDLGWSDVGCMGSEISTPNLDRLANEGLRYSQFYNTGRCWPTRGALLSGYYAQPIRRDALPGIRSGGQGQRPAWAVLLPERLAAAGYHSYHVGKWHVDSTPLAAGFEHSYRLDDHGRFFAPRNHWLDNDRLPTPEPDSGFYVTKEKADQAVRMLSEHQQLHANDPFFLYLAFTAPHFPLHALPEDIAIYRDRYLEGWQALREQRLAKQQELGFMFRELSEVEPEIGPPYAFPEAIEQLGSGEVNRPHPWDSLTDEQRRFQATKMAIHAAMIHRMDLEIGRVLEQIEAMGQSENTVIMFLSDNGASAEMMIRDDGHDPNAEPGSAASHLCLGPGFSNAANTPFRRHKTWVYEGGIRTPLIVHWPRGIPAQVCGQIRSTPGHVIDIVPTLLEAAGLEAKIEADAPGLMGRSLLPTLTADTGLGREYLWWSHEGNRALRIGDWKVVTDKDGPWELFDLGSDPTESHDLAAQLPERVREMVEQWQAIENQFLEIARRDLPAQSPQN